MTQLSNQENLRSGIVSIVGRPNTGKSTLVNYILKEKVAIVSTVPQTTRHQMRGIYNDERGQIVFIDTPGVHLGKDKLDQFMHTSSLAALDGADCIIHLVDSSEATGKEERVVIESLRNIKAPIIVGLNKIDLKGKYVAQYIELWQEIKKKPVTEIEGMVLLPLSSKTGHNVDTLLDLIFERLPQGPALYPQDIISDVPQKIMIADIIREKFLRLMRDEVPHSLAVVVDQVVPKKNKLTYISAQVLVERESQKEIVIGKGGQILKKVGTQAREELEEILGGKVFLEIFVRLEKKWREDHSLLEEMGYTF